MHGGHTNRVSDFAWNPNDPWVMVSAAEDNLIQCWKVSNTIVAKDMDDVAADELEQ
jgi:histone-binding protein RBBP4